MQVCSLEYSLQQSWLFHIFKVYISAWNSQQNSLIPFSQRHKTTELSKSSVVCLFLHFLIFIGTRALHSCKHYSCSLLSKSEGYPSAPLYINCIFAWRPGPHPCGRSFYIFNNTPCKKIHDLIKTLKSVNDVMKHKQFQFFISPPPKTQPWLLSIKS